MFVLGVCPFSKYRQAVLTSERLTINTASWHVNSVILFLSVDSIAISLSLNGNASYIIMYVLRQAAGKNSLLCFSLRDSWRSGTDVRSRRANARLDFI